MIKGIPVSKGYAIAKTFILNKPKIDTQKRIVMDPDLEIRRYHDAIEKTKNAIEKLRMKSIERFGEETSKIFDAHLMIAEDPEIKTSVESMISHEKCNLTYALKTVVDRFLKLFNDLDNQYLRERALDLKDVSERILSFAVGIQGHDLSDIHEEVILVAEDITPSETTQLDTRYIKGFITEQGGMTSHSAIIARLLNLPAVAGIKDVFKRIKDGDEIIIDGFTGKVILNYDEKTKAEYIEKLKHYHDLLSSLSSYIGKESTTEDGYQTKLLANIGSPKDVDLVLSNDAEGIGLFRTELLYMDKTQMPSEEEQFLAYQEVLEKMGDKPVTIRTLDIGGDKYLPYLKLEHELNPFLGKRAIRLSLTYPEVFKSQLRALMRASLYGQLKIMIPMISTKEEIIQVKKIIKSIKDDFDEKNIPYGTYQLGIMIEVPSAVMIADVLAKEVDFFSIGTNDLIQYTFAADRTHEGLSQYYQPLHPSILKMIDMVVTAAHHQKIEVSVCGEMAGNLLQGLLLLGLGVDSLSMTPSEILKMRRVLSINSYDKLTQIAQSVLKYESEDQVLREIKKWITLEGDS
ncbi:MAG: phosphoenolpyruvate--protein phosphotransferase [Acholeplasmataceae bacterium]|jgi:phosphotransferase system enzyme I (PtsI)|nr:phosphoenolpyruvate--protein phosphotransferase [Acholeplasmataceae bacterium]